jgi:bifunctional non-homologous end joining protein LigD
VVVIEERAPARHTSKRSPIASELEALEAPRQEVLPRDQSFMLATLADKPFSREGWLFEIKYDGIRVLASRRESQVELIGRSRQVITGRYPEVVAALRTLPVDRFLIDGEIAALDAAGRPSFQRLQSRMGLTNPHDIERAAALVPVDGIFFDCLMLDGYDLRGLPLAARKAFLAKLLPSVGSIRYGDHVLTEGEAFYRAASDAQVEGIVAKKTASAYVGGRSRDWIKIKCHRRQEFVIGGYTDPQGSRPYFGALHMGVYEGHQLVYVSKVGTGFDEKTLKSLWERLQPLARSTSPFATRSPTGRGHHWVEPRLVGEVRFTEWTDDGGVRHPTFLGLRSDKRPEECRREPTVPAPTEDVRPTVPTAPASEPERGVRFTNRTKVFWPADGYTKGDLIGYYDSISAMLLPYLEDRPLVLTRYPDGIAGKSFFQKDAPDFVPSWVRTERIYSKDVERLIDYFIVDDATTLSYVINLGTIPLHLWGARLASLDRPDWLILDLDPKGAPFTNVVKVAQTLHGILDELELPSYVKTSGATGLHILLPLGARYSHEDARNFARLLALMAVDALPDIGTIARSIHSRGGKVYVDFGQNGHGLTIVAPYSVRPLPGAPVSCPLRWSEVTASLDPSRFTIVTLPKRFAKMDDPLAPVLAGSIDMAAAVARLERRVAVRRRG